MVNAQNWLDKNYPKEIRSSVKNLYLREKQLEGSLDLQSFVNLEKLDCCFNQLTSLGLNGLKQLRVVYANDNLLSKFDYSSLDARKLTGLIIDNNNLPRQNIEVFSQFFNLEDLRIGSDDREKTEQGIYNRFYGSLESLKNLTRLGDLSISNTDISSGVDYLPASVEKIRYSTTRQDCRLKEIIEELSSFLNREINEDWKTINSDFAEWKEREWKDRYFSYWEAKKWIDTGLCPDDWNLAAYLRAEGYSPGSELSIEELRKEDRNTQKYVNEKYSASGKEWENWLDISRSGLEEGLVLENWSNLERLDCYNNQLTGLILNNLPELTRVECSDNMIANLVVNNCPKLKILNISNNYLTDLNFLDNLSPKELVTLYITNNDFSSQDVAVFSKFVNLKYLYLANNNFYGNLQSLKDLTKLEKLGISGTKINEDLEYLPDDLKEVALVSSQQLGKNTSGFKIVRWTNLVKEKEYHNIPYYDLQYWKEAQPAFQKLKESWEKLHPDQSIWDFLKRENIFFNVRLGNFQANDGILISFLQKDQIISEGERKIRLLQDRVTNLEQIVKRESKELLDKINNRISKYPEEKEDLSELVKVKLELEELKKKNQPFDVQAKKFRKIYKQLPDELPEEFIEGIIDDCVKLVGLKLELERENELLFAEEKIQQVQPFKRERNQSLLIKLAEIKATLKRAEEEVEYLRNRSITPPSENPNESLVSQAINQLRGKQTLTAEETNQVNNYLQAKKNFLNARQETTKELKECLNELEKSFSGKKRAIIGEIGSAISNTGGAIGAVTFGIPKAVGETILASNNFSKIKLTKKHSKEFQIFLENEESELTQLNNAYNSLIDVLNLKEEKSIETKLFSAKYKVFDIVIKDGVWEDRPLTTEKMEKAIISLSENLEELKKELVQETKQFKEFCSGFSGSVNNFPRESGLVVDWTNIHSDFTSQLVKKWQKYSFTCEQCKEWININALNQQSQALKEPQFYAWLRDEFKMTPEQVINELSLVEIQGLRGQFQELKQQLQALQLTNTPLKTN